MKNYSNIRTKKILLLPKAKINFVIISFFTLKGGKKEQIEGFEAQGGRYEYSMSKSMNLFKLFFFFIRLLNDFFFFFLFFFMFQGLSA